MSMEARPPLKWACYKRMFLSVNVDIDSVRSNAHHGRRWDGNLDNFAFGGINEGLEILEVLDLDRLVVSINCNSKSIDASLKKKDRSAHVILPVTAREGGL